MLGFKLIHVNKKGSQMPTSGFIADFVWLCLAIEETLLMNMNVY